MKQHTTQESKIEYLFAQKKWFELKQQLTNWHCCAVGEKLHLQNDPRTQVELSHWLEDNHNELFILGQDACHYAIMLDWRYGKFYAQKLRETLDKIKEHK